MEAAHQLANALTMPEHQRSGATVLITGFGPFPGAAVNPSAVLVRRLTARRRPALAGIELFGHVFETSYRAVEQELPQLMGRYRPDVVLMFGLAARTPYVRIETRAVNRRSVLLADAIGWLPKTAAIRRNGPSSLVGRAPHHRLMLAGRLAGVPTKLSRNAGTYLCNFAYWLGLEYEGQRRGPMVQFVHIPAPARTRLSLNDLARAGEAMLLALVAARR